MHNHGISSYYFKGPQDSVSKIEPDSDDVSNLSLEQATEIALKLISQIKSVKEQSRKNEEIIREYEEELRQSKSVKHKVEKKDLKVVKNDVTVTVDTEQANAFCLELEQLTGLSAEDCRKFVDAFIKFETELCDSETILTSIGEASSNLSRETVVEVLKVAQELADQKYKFLIQKDIVS